MGDAQGVLAGSELDGRLEGLCNFGGLESSCLLLGLLSLQDRGSLLLLSFDETWYKEDCRGGKSEDPIHTQSILRSLSRRHGGGDNAADELEDSPERILWGREGMQWNGMGKAGIGVRSVVEKARCAVMVNG